MPQRTTIDRSVSKAEHELSTGRRGFLRAGTGLAATVVGLATFGGTAAAHFPDGLDVDIRPGSEVNPINPNSRGVVSVAVLGTDSFDPTTEAVRYRFGAPDVVSSGGGARPVHSHVARAEGRGRDNLVLHFRMADTGFDGDESYGRVEWERNEEGTHGLSGTDTVTPVGGGPR